MNKQIDEESYYQTGQERKRKVCVILYDVFY